MCIAKKKGRHSFLMQSEANEIYLPPKQPMDLKYSNLLLLVYYSAFYIQLWPPGVALFLIGLLLNYISDKCLTVKRYSKIEAPGEAIAIDTANTVVGGVILLVAGNFIFIYQFEPKLMLSLIYGLVPIVIVLVFVIVSGCCCTHISKKNQSGCRKFFAKLCNKDSEKFDDQFEHVEYNLSEFGESDYMALNPLTKKAALLELVRKKKMLNSSIRPQQKTETVMIPIIYQ